MKSKNRETPRILLYSYYEKYKHLGKMFTIDSFISEGEKRTTIYDIIDSFEFGITQNTNQKVVGQQKFSTNS